MTKLPTMPVYVERLLADTGHLTNEELGAYCRLLFHGWLHGGEIRLADMPRIIYASPKRWERLWPRLEPFWTLSGDKTYTQKRLKETLEKTLELHKVNQVRAAKARAGIGRKINAAPRNDRRVHRPVDSSVKALHRDAALPDQLPQSTVKALHTKEEEVSLPINRQRDTSSDLSQSEKRLPEAVDNVDNADGPTEPDADERGDRGDQETLPQPSGAADDLARPRSLFAKLEEARRRAKEGGAAKVSEQGR